MPATTLATTAAITAVTTKNKPIQAKSESVGAVVVASVVAGICSHSIFML